MNKFARREVPAVGRQQAVELETMFREVFSILMVIVLNGQW